MKKYCFLVIYLMILFAFPKKSHADIQFDIIMPGGEGSTEEAQPYLNEFYKLLSQSSKTKWSGKYFTSIESSSLVDKKPNVSAVIIPVEDYKKVSINKNTSIIMQTIPVYSETPTETLELIKGPKSKLLSKPITLYTSFSYNKTKLIEDFPELSSNAEFITIENTSEILAKLKEISNGTSQNWALLSGYESFVLRNLKNKNLGFDNLMSSAKSQPKPSAVVVLFDPEKKETIIQALTSISTNSDARETLQFLRLKGFTDQYKI